MTHDDFRRRAAAVRDVPLVAVLVARGAVRDRHDRCKWHSEQGPLSITDAKFINWSQHRGGGGAIDLVMHLARVDYRAAVVWLEQRFTPGPITVGGSISAPSHHASSSPAQRHRSLRLPVPNDQQRGRVLRYLTERRRLAAALLRPLLESGRLYADSRGNAVFLLVAGRAQRPVGAELRGTGPRVWRGMAPGTRKDLGYFWSGTRGAQDIVLCESAIKNWLNFILGKSVDRNTTSVCSTTSFPSNQPRTMPSLFGRGRAATRCRANQSVVGRFPAPRPPTSR